MATQTEPERITASLLYSHPRNYLEEVRDLGCRLIVQNKGEDLAALVTMEDFRLLERLKSREACGVSLSEIDEETA